ncbi:N-acyl-aromatic-L-amino acid amidohydrolase (carboxylate-forming) B-like [Nerophis lumbriciformis]|uniref:N-acyl-aromatic-L-amino acid amidohydrolase (carboxylate-forming) B-like n=1 Tax=Nerophis lumbriciformis TaxID=546530 RepID=UPI002ADF9A59|nr:N-acyl-aromatic-L-amino acid amidohydrolase (carboxylate-forming) B-like [Nerophis lumbriciformis]XP_061839996.1 N-acyl-aromatic-L-amino acid amidohydrolase (carboxylate-forming) B-like [Nerophis lumbriciformis]
MEHLSLPPLTRFAVCGGTHGNEMTGVHVVRQMEKNKVDKVGNASVMAVLSNPDAVKECRRYIEKDLNRCFTYAMLSAPLGPSSTQEMKRAHELNALLGPKGSPEAVDLICDLHNTTSNTGPCFILCKVDWIVMHICKYVQSKALHWPVAIIQMDADESETYSLDTVGKHGFSLEVGPQPTGVVRADIYNMVKEILELILEWLQKFNSGFIFEGGQLEAFNWTKTIDYPRDPTTNEITAAIHPQLQDNDFKLLRPGDPIFLSFTGETITHQGEAAYPFFVNECAYYEKKIAFHLAEKISVSIPSISMEKSMSINKKNI